MINERISESKQQVFNDWKKEFSNLKPIAKNKYFKTIGPIAVGLELINLPGGQSYRPHFAVYPLWKKTIKDCFKTPFVLMEIYNLKGLQFSIPYLGADKQFIEAVNCTKEQVPIPFELDIVPLSYINNTIDKQFKDILIQSNSAQQGKLLELIFYCSLYAGANNLILTQLIGEIEMRAQVWNKQMFNYLHGDFEKWLLSLKRVKEEPNEFFRQVKVNMNDKIIKKLQNSKLI